MSNQQLYLSIGIPILFNAGFILALKFWADARFDAITDRLTKMETSLEMLNGTLHEIDKRLGILEDRAFGRGGAPK